jgi:hypothetical protein
MMDKLLLFLLFTSLSAFGNEDNFCMPLDVKLKSLGKLDNTMAFDNDGRFLGIDTGICWWHTRFHRNLHYLAHFAADCSAPDTSSDQGQKYFAKIIKDIMRGKAVTIIPGFKNARDFTSDPHIEDLINKRFQKEIHIDGLLKFSWVKGLQGSSNWSFKNRNQEKKRARQVPRQDREIDEIEAELNQGYPVYVMLQHPGAATHALLVFDYEEIDDGELVTRRLFTQDSNFQSYLERIPSRPYRMFDYVAGIWRNPDQNRNRSFNVYVQRRKETRKVVDKFKAYCKKQSKQLMCPNFN